MGADLRVHGSCVARDGAGVLIVGASGSGKSDLVLRLLGRGFALVADDQVDISDGRAWAPNALAGMLEVRGLGIIRLPYMSGVKLNVVIALTDQTERLPHPERYAALDLPLVHLTASGASAPDRVALALDCALGRVSQVAGALRRMSDPATPDAPVPNTPALNVPPSNALPGNASVETPSLDTGRRRIVVVTGLSGGGKASILHALEDVGYDTVDNLPMGLVRDVASRADRDIAIGVDARTRGFSAELVLDTLASLRDNPALLTELVFVWADEATLLRRYTETRRRHPLAPRGRVAEGIEIEQEITAPLREAANLIIDTSDLPLARLRRLIERHFGPGGNENDTGMVVSLISFAYVKGLPKEADLVFDARFLRNPHYDPILRARTGLDPEVGAYIREDQDYAAYLSRMCDLVDLVLPRFVYEGKKYATIAIGCTGGRHRSVYLVERLAAHLSSRLATARSAGEIGLDWRQTVTHRELISRDQAKGWPTGESVTEDALPGAENTAPVGTRNHVQADGDGKTAAPIQAQEA